MPCATASCGQVLWLPENTSVTEPSALSKVCLTLAKMIVRDGEGATKLAEVRIQGARSLREARQAAEAVATSPLVKTTLFGQDINWGRVMAALGRSGARFDPARVDLSVDEIPVVRRGLGLGPRAEAAASFDARSAAAHASTTGADAGNFWDEARRTKWLDDFANKPEARAALKNNQWNHYRIVAQGDHIRSWVNGVPCADFRDSTDATGFIGLQVHGIKKGTGPYQVRWKNIRRLRPLIYFHKANWEEVGQFYRGSRYVPLLYLPDDALEVAVNRHLLDT